MYIGRVVGVAIWCRVCGCDVVQASRRGTECYYAKCPYVSDTRKVEREMADRALAQKSPPEVKG